MDLKEGLSIAEGFKIDCLQIETEALQVMSMHTDIGGFLDNPLANLLRDIGVILGNTVC